MKVFRLSRVHCAAAAAVAVILLGMAAHAGQTATSPAVTVLSKDFRRALSLTVLNDQEFVSLDDLSAIFQLTVQEEALGAFTVGYKGKTILLTPDQPLASIAGRLVSLPAAPVRSGRRWLVPVEFVGRALALIYDTKLDLRKTARLIVVGDLRVPRVTVRFEGGDPARLVIDAMPRTGNTLSQENNALVVRFEADALEPVIPPIQPQGLVQAVRIAEPATIVIDLGPRFASFRASTLPRESTNRLTIDVLPGSSPTETTAAAPAVLPPPDLSVLGQPTSSFRTVALDPGHGGDDAGVRGARGTAEKDLTLAVARRAKAAIESRLGIRVLLTRDDDRNVPLDSRAAVANNNKADAFISLHANASFRNTTAGAAVLCAAFDHEAEQSSRASSGSERLPTFGGGQRDIDMVLWDLAQVGHLDRSIEFAKILESQFRGRILLSPRSLDRAPLGVLESANMPAVLIEMGFLTNPNQESQMAGAEFQNTIVQAIYEAIVKFRDAPGSGGTR